MPGKRTQQFVRILLLVGTLVSGYFVPWKLLGIRLTPLPDTVAEQVADAVGYGFAGVIVYVDRAGAPPAHYAAGYHDREARTPADPPATPQEALDLMLDRPADFAGYEWAVSEVVYDRIMRIVAR